MICIFKCPGCDSNMTFNVEKQKLECTTCGTEIAVEEYDAGEITLDGGKKCPDETTTYECPTCGAEMLTETSQATCTCNYCGTEMAVFGGGEGKVSPEKIIPFKISKEQADMHFKKWWLDHDTMPDFDMKKMQLDIRPMYLPVWLVNARVITNMGAIVKRLEVSDNPYLAAASKYRVSTPLSRVNDKDNKSLVTRTYSVNKTVSSLFNYVPSNASYHFSSTRFQGIEPYDYDELEEFAPGYLSGFPAEQYSVKVGDVIPRTIARTRDFGMKQCRKYIMVGSAGVSDMEQELFCLSSVDIQEACYALVPVWLCSYRYNKKRYTVYVNGQTGKADGEVIVGEEKAYSNFGIVTAANFWLLFGILSVVYPAIANLFTVVYGKYLVLLIFYMIGMPLISFFAAAKNPNSELSKQAQQRLWDSQIDYHKKKANAPGRKIMKKVLIGTVTFLFGLLLYDGMKKLMAIKMISLYPEMLFFALLGGGIWTYLSMVMNKGKNTVVKEEVEYHDYLQISESEVVNTSERIISEQA